MQLDSEIELPFTGATVGDDSTLQYTLNFPGCNLSPPHCPLSPDIASLEVHFRIIITISPTDISLKRHSCPCVNIQWTSVEIHLGFHLMTMLESQMRNTGNFFLARICIYRVLCVTILCVTITFQGSFLQNHNARSLTATLHVLIQAKCKYQTKLNLNFLCAPSSHTFWESIGRTHDTIQGLITLSPLKTRKPQFTKTFEDPNLNMGVVTSSQGPSPIPPLRFSQSLSRV